MERNCHSKGSICCDKVEFKIAHTRFCISLYRCFPACFPLLCFCLFILLTSSSQFHPLSFIFSFILWEKQLFTDVQDPARVLTAAFRVWSALRRDTDESRLATMPEMIPFPCYHLSSPWKKPKRHWSPWGKAFNIPKFQRQRENKYLLLCGKDMDGGCHQFILTAFGVFSVSLLNSATSVSEFNLFLLASLGVWNRCFLSLSSFSVEYFCGLLPNSQWSFWQMRI